MKSLMLLLSAVVFTAGCKELEGTLHVNQPLQIIKDGRVDQVIQAGSYRVDIENEERKNRLEIEVKDVDGDEYKFKYTYPAGFQFPENGSFSVPASMSNQMYDLEGHNTTTVQATEVRREWESCTIDHPYYDCYYDQYGRRYCRPGHRWGRRMIEYRDITTVRTTDVALVNAGMNAATMRAGRSDTRRQYLHTGYCR